MQLAIASAIVGGGLAATGKFMEGQERSAAQRFESQQLVRQEQTQRTASAWAAALRRDRLTSSLETIMAIRSGRGVGEGSPTGLASLSELTDDESRDIRTERLNYLTRAEEARMASRMKRRQSGMSLLAGYIGAGAEVASTGYRVGSLRTGVRNPGPA